MATLFTIKIDDSKRPQPEYMDMVINRPRKASKFKSPKDYTRKQKHKKGLGVTTHENISKEAPHVSERSVRFCFCA